MDRLPHNVTGLGIGENRIERRAAAFDLGEDVIAGTVQNAVQSVDAIARNAFAEHRMNRQTAGDACLHCQVDARRDGAIPNLRAALRH